MTVLVPSYIFMLGPGAHKVLYTTVKAFCSHSAMTLRKWVFSCLGELTVSWTNEPQCIVVPPFAFLLDFPFFLVSFKPLVETTETQCVFLYVQRSPDSHLLWIIDLLNLGRLRFICKQVAAAAAPAAAERHLTVCFKNYISEDSGGDHSNGKTTTCWCRCGTIQTYWKEHFIATSKRNVKAYMP